jgi:hypothetical protein
MVRMYRCVGIHSKVINEGSTVIYTSNDLNLMPGYAPHCPFYLDPNEFYPFTTCSIWKVQYILDSAGLSHISVTNWVTSSPLLHTPEFTDLKSNIDTTSTAPYSGYQSPSPYYFTTEEISQRAKYVKWATKVSTIIDHPVHIILEYPISHLNRRQRPP